MNKEIFFPKYDMMETITFDVKNEEFINSLKLRVYETDKGYRSVQTSSGSTVLARLLYMREHNVELQRDQLIDHINGNPLDNRLENLRVATKKQNAHNHKVYKSNKLGVSGVKIQKGKNVSAVFIVNWNEDGKQRTSKPFRYLHDAIKFRYSKEVEIYGDYRRLGKSLEEVLKETENTYLPPFEQRIERVCPNCNLKLTSSFHQHVAGCVNKLISSIKDSPSDGDILECHICQQQITRSKFKRHCRSFHNN